MENAISVLIVEDEQVWIHSLQLILNDFGFNVAGVASTVEEALSAFSSADYDIVLMDINLNGRINGIELGKILNIAYNKPFIFVTSSSGHCIKDAALSNPSAYLPKPIHPNSLYVAIQNAFNNFNNNTVATPDKSIDESFSSFFVKHGNRYKRIDWKDVAYLSAGKNYISVFNSADKTEYFIRGSLQKTMQHIIPRQLQRHFMQLNRSEAVQFSFIQEVANDEVRTVYKNFALSEAFGRELKSRMNIVS